MALPLSVVSENCFVVNEKSGNLFYPDGRHPSLYYEMGSFSGSQWVPSKNFSIHSVHGPNEFSFLDLFLFLSL